GFRRSKARHRTLRPRQWAAPRREPEVSTAAIAPASTVQKRGGAFGALVDNDRWLMRAMLAPAIVYIVLLVGVPFMLSLYYSLSSVTIASRDMHFVGLENFQRVIDSRTFWLALQNT